MGSAIIQLFRGFSGMVTIAVANQKGGVGKTTIAFNLAQILSSRCSTKVLAIDNDPQGNLTSSFLEDPSEIDAHTLKAYNEELFAPAKLSENLYLLGSDITLAQVAERDFQVISKLKESIKRIHESLKGAGFDYVVIDCLPSFGYLHLAALNAADYVLIPVKPAPYALAGLKDLFNTIKKAKKYYNPKLKVLGIAINQVDGRKPVIEREMEEVLRETYGDLVLKAMINKRVKVEESPAFQQPITVYDPRGPSVKEFRAMTNEIISRIKNIGNENDRKH
jgi:chromosome partitioning protein